MDTPPFQRLVGRVVVEDEPDAVNGYTRAEVSSRKSQEGDLVFQGTRGDFFRPPSPPRPCELLVQELLRAKRDLDIGRVLKKLRHYQVIIVDDIGYVQQSREEMEVLFSLLSDRYERGSLMVTSNLAFSEWEKIFKDPMTTAAAIDRLVHHSIILELNLPSYRLEQAKKRKKG